MSETTIEITVSGDNAAEAIAQIAEQLPEGTTVVNAEEAAAASSASAGPSFEDRLFEAGEASAGLPLQLSEWFAGFSANSNMGVLTALLVSLGILAAAWGIERFVASAVLSRRAAKTVDESNGIARTGAALRFLFGMALRLILFNFLVRFGLTAVFAQSSEAMELGRAVLGTAMVVRVWYAIIETLAAPRAPERRATGLSDGEAAHVMRALTMLLVVMALTNFALQFVVGVVDAGSSGAFFAVVARLLSGLAVAAFFVAIRKPVGKLILLAFASDRGNPGIIVRSFATFWPVLYIVLQVLQILVEARGYLAGTLGSDADSVKRSFATFVLAPFVVAGIREWGQHLVAKSKSAARAVFKDCFPFLKELWSSALVYSSFTRGRLTHLPPI